MYTYNQYIFNSFSSKGKRKNDKRIFYRFIKLPKGQDSR